MVIAYGKKDWIENLRALATIAVIILHVAAPAVVTTFEVENTSIDWWISNVYDGLTRFCVPIFVMITGSLLIPQDLPYKSSVTKRLKRIIFPFFFWFAFYTSFNFILKIRDDGGFTIQEFFAWIAMQIVDLPAVHLWYVVMLIGLYLFIPIISPWLRKASKKEIEFFLAVWFITIIIGQQPFIEVNNPLGLNYFAGYIGYIVLGYYLADRFHITSQTLILSIVIFLAATAVTIFGTFYWSVMLGHFSDYFYDYLTINVLWQSIAIFLLLQTKMALQTRFILYIRNIINKYGFGIYLSHLFIISLLSFAGLDYQFIHPVVGIPVTAIVCLTLSAVVVIALKALPFGKYISG